jgi:hypothetical protein
VALGGLVCLVLAAVVGYGAWKPDRFYGLPQVLDPQRKFRMYNMLLWRLVGIPVALLLLVTGVSLLVQAS